MKPLFLKNSIIILIISFILIVPGVAYASKKPSGDNRVYKLFILHSYGPDYYWSRDINEGIFSTFNRENDENQVPPGKRLPYKHQIFYMDTKNNTSEEYFSFIANKALRSIKSFDPDVIISADDNAARLVVKRLVGTKYPVSFCGVNGDIVKYGLIKSYQEAGTTVTGVIERFNYREIAKLAKMINPGLQTITLVFDDSVTARIVADTIKDQLKPEEIKIKNVVITGSWDEWKKAILQNQEKTNVLLPIFFYTLKDSANNAVDPERVLKWLLENSNVPEYATTSFQVREGFFGSVSVLGRSHGYEAALKAIAILRGEKPENIRVSIPKIGSVDINIERAEMLGIEIPFDLLSYATVHKKMEVYERERR